MGSGEVYLTSKQAAELLNLSPKTLERMRSDGTGPRFLKAGNGVRCRILYKPNDIDAWLEARAYQSTSEYEDATI